MKQKQRGIVLIVVLMVSMLLLILLMATLTLSSRNALYMAHHQYRTQALLAAEAGVMKAMDYLESNATAAANTVIEGTLADSQATYKATILENNLGSTGRARILSEGTVRPFKRTVKVEVAQAPGGYVGMGSDGPILYDGEVFINGIKSVKNPAPDSGWLHSNGEGQSVYGSAGGGNVHCNGKVSGKGTVSGVKTSWNSHSNYGSVSIPSAKNTYASDEKKNSIKDIKAKEDFKKDSEEDCFIVENDMMIECDENDTLVLEGNLKMKDGKTLWVKGNLEVKGAVEGTGVVVVGGKTSLKGGQLDKSGANQGVVIYSEKDLVVANPAVDRDADGNMKIDGALPEESGSYAVSNFFAQMPEFAPAQISHGLPDDDAAKSDFFGWYHTEYNKNPRSADFNRWYQGVNGDPACPGLPEDVRNWLAPVAQNKDGIVQNLAAWQTTK
ncbi:MAG: hypothetical protein RDV48_08575 [Candidatus Eremiobacteraeota bacterium]|nr:hypothetical protein [Candidatus Eremiobacteraeota bacterium]